MSTVTETLRFADVNISLTISENYTLFVKLTDRVVLVEFESNGGKKQKCNYVANAGKPNVDVCITYRKPNRI